MRNVQKDYMFNYFIQGMDSKMQATLNMMYLNSLEIDEMNHRREMEQMKKEIADDVLSRISATIDVEALLKSIKELDDEINKLGK